MENKLFIDTNVILDLLLDRPALGGYAKSFFLNVTQSKKELLTSISCIQTTIYVLEKRKHSREEIAKSIIYLNQLVKLADTNSEDITIAVESEINDLEDAILYYTAISNGCDIFVTQNLKDFPDSNSVIKILSPQEYTTL